MQTRAGHGTLALTLDTYGHLLDVNDSDGIPRRRSGRAGHPVKQQQETEGAAIRSSGAVAVLVGSGLVLVEERRAIGRLGRRERRVNRTARSPL